MPYLFLCLSILADSLKGIAGKRTSYDTKTINDVSFFYGLRMLFCIIIGAVLILIFDGPNGFAIDWISLLIAFATGASFALNCMLWIFAQRKGAFVICNILAVGSSIIPVLLSYFIYNETFSWIDILGYLIILGGCILIVTYNKQINKKVSLSLIIIYILYIFAVAMTDFGKKIYKVNFDLGKTCLSANGFTFYTFVFCVLVYLIFYCVTYKKESFKYQKSIFLKELPFVSIAAALTYIYSYLLIPASVIEPALLYSLKNGVTLIIGSIIGIFYVKEKPTLRFIIGMLIVIIGILIIGIF